MLYIEQLSRYDNNANFRVVIQESPVFATEPDTLPFSMFVARKLQKNHWCIYGMTMDDLNRICGKKASLETMILTVSEVGTKITNDLYILSIISCDSRSLKQYDKSNPDELHLLKIDYTDALNWWHTLNYEEKFIETLKWLKSKNKSLADCNPHKLKNNEIQKIYNKNKNDVITNTNT